MATITSAQSGLSTATTTWAGGVVPVVGDKVIIAAGHTVTLAAHHVWGDETTTAIDVRGTLKASRSVSSSLTCRGNITTTVTTGGVAGAWLDFGTRDDPIPAAVTATLAINDSATPTANKWMADLSARQRLTFWGAYKNPWTRSVASAAVGATTVTVDDATGWQVGDYIVLVDTSGTTHQLTTVQAISGNTVTLGQTMARAKATRFVVANLSRNVTVKSANKLYPGRVQVNLTAGVWSSIAKSPESVGMHSFGYMGFEDLGSSVEGRGMYYYDTDSVYNTAPAANFEGMSVYVTVIGGAATGQWSQSVYAGYVNPYPMSKCIFFAPNASSPHLAMGAAVYATDCLLLSNSNMPNIGGTIGTVWERGMIATLQLLIGASSRNCTFRDVQLSGVQYLAWSESTNITLDGVSFGLGEGAAPMMNTRWVYLNNSRGTKLVNCEVTGCKMPLGYTRGNLADVDSVVLDEDFLLKFTRSNGANVHEWKRKYGMLYNDSATRRSGDFSMRFEPTAAVPGRRAFMEFAVASVSGQPVTVVGYLRKNTNYGSVELPSVTLGGLGAVPATFTMSDSNNGWQKFTLTVTQNSGVPGDLILRWESYYNGNGGSSTWLDGIYFPPFTTAARHYGYLIDEKNIARKVDPVCTLTEAQALALPVAINHAAKTVTLTGAVTVAEVYQACMADLCQTANLSQPVYVAMVGGALTTSYTVVGESFLSGSFTDSAGKRVTISVPNCLNKSRIQLFNVTDGVEVANVETAGPGYSLRVTYTGDKTVRLRLGYAWGTTAMLPIEAVGVLSSSGLTFLDTQVPDNVYNALGIDGGTCTEFIPDFPNLLIDVSDDDGTTSVQRLYAWAAWTQTSGPGIAAMFRAVTAQDTSNFVIDPAVVNAKVHNVRATPVTVVGGALSRSDGSSVISPTSGPIHLAPGRAYVSEIQASTFNTMLQMLQRVQTKVDASL